MSEEKRVLENIRTAHAILDEAKLMAKQELTRVKALVERAEAAFRDAVESGVHVSGTGDGQKLRQVECEWQRLEEAKAEAKMTRVTMRDAVKDAKLALERAIAAGAPEKQ